MKRKLDSSISRVKVGSSDGEVCSSSSHSSHAKLCSNAPVISGASRGDILSKMAAVMRCGGRVGRDLVVGYNSVMRLVELGHAAVVCIGRDSNRTMLQCMLDAAKIKSVVVMIVPKLSASCKMMGAHMCSYCDTVMKEVLGLKSASCFGLRTTHHQIRKSYKDCSNVCTTNLGSAADDHHVGSAADDHHGGSTADDHHEGSADDAAACDDFLQATIDELRDHLLALVTCNRSTIGFP